MGIFKTKPFAKLAEAEGLSDPALIQAIKEVQKGLIDAQLGSNLIKKRIAIGGKGKRGGLRTILVYQESAQNIFCVYPFFQEGKRKCQYKTAGTT